MKPAHILVIRLSAMGDVAMTVPVIQQVLQQNPQVRLTVLTQGFLAPLFEPLERTSVYAVDTKGAHKGLKGLLRLSRELKKNSRFDAIADLHNVLRSQILRLLFKTSGIPASVIDKGRMQKRRLTRKRNKKLMPLKSSFQRYADVFKELGLSLSLNTSQPVYPRLPLPAAAAHFFEGDKKNICIAPFARHQEKTYPADKMKTVIRKVADQDNIRLFLLGGGSRELSILKEWEKEFPRVINLGGKFSFSEELAIISHLDLMVSMDSANMHLASLFGIPVISVWGATHMYAGFYGWSQPSANVVQIDLYCRPCSVFGDKPCYRGDHACMEQLAPELILDKLVSERNSSG